MFLELSCCIWQKVFQIGFVFLSIRNFLFQILPVWSCTSVFSCGVQVHFWNGEGEWHVLVGFSILGRHQNHWIIFCQQDSFMCPLYIGHKWLTFNFAFNFLKHKSFIWNGKCQSQKWFVPVCQTCCKVWSKPITSYSVVNPTLYRLWNYRVCTGGGVSETSCRRCF